MLPTRPAQWLMRAGAAVLSVVLATTAGTALAALPNGVDTSHYQHSPSLNWASVKSSGAKFAFLKATEGSSYRDPYFSADWSATAANGLYRGAYHFARPSIGSAVSQAKYFASVIGPQGGRGTLPPVLDLEASGGLSRAQLVSWTHTWLSTVQDLTGRIPMIYVSPGFWEYYLGNNTGFHAYPLWVAHYGVSSPRVPGGWSTWSFWQSTSSARVTGISGNVDKDVFNGSLTQLAKMANAYSAAATNLTLTTSNAAPMTGQSITLSGTLKTTTGSAATGRTVTLQSRDPGATTWTTEATTTASSTGAYSFKDTVTAARTYHTTFAGDATYKASSSPLVSVALTPRPTALSLATSTASGRAGAPLQLSGKLLVSPSSPLPRQPLTVSRRLTGSTAWTVLGTPTTAADGSWTLSTAMRSTGTYRATYGGSTAYTTATSPTPAVTVTPNPTALTFAVSNAKPYVDQSVTMSGDVSSGSTPVAGRTVSIERSLPGSTTWTRVGVAKTDTDGGFTTRTPVDQAGSYRATLAGDWLYAAGTSASRAVTITPPAASRLTMTVPSNATTLLAAGKPVLLSGRLTTPAGTPIAGRLVRMWKHSPSNPQWYRVGSPQVVDSTGHWQLSVQPKQGCWFEARFYGGPQFTPANSPRLRVNVG